MHTRNPAHPAVFYGSLALAGAVIIGGALWWRKASAAAMPTGTDDTGGGSTRPSKPSSDDDLLSGPLRWGANGDEVRVGQTSPGGVTKIKRVHSYRKFAYGTGEFLEPQVGVYFVDPLTDEVLPGEYAIEPGDFGWAIQIAPSLDPIHSPTVYATEAGAASGARSFINNNFDWLEERMLIG